MFVYPFSMSFIACLDICIHKYMNVERSVN